MFQLWRLLQKEGKCLNEKEPSDTKLWMFFPRYGVNEDPVCGTGNAALASYLIHNNIVEAKGEKVKIIGEQGYSVARPGKVRVEASYKNDKIENVLISGSAVLVFEGYVYVK